MKNYKDHLKETNSFYKHQENMTDGNKREKVYIYNVKNKKLYEQNGYFKTIKKSVSKIYFNKL